MLCNGVGDAGHHCGQAHGVGGHAGGRQGERGLGAGNAHATHIASAVAIVENARIGVGAATGMYTPSASELAEMTEFGAFVEGVRNWGRAERAKLGL